MSIATDRMMQFSQTYRLRLSDTGAERVVPGKFGELADMGDKGLLRMRLLAVPRSANFDTTLKNRRKLAEAAGLVCKWRGHAESIFYFDPENAEQVALVIRLVGAKRRRLSNMSPEQRKAVAERFASAKAQRAA